MHHAGDVFHDCRMLVSALYMENTRLARLLDDEIVIRPPSESLACPARRNSSLAQPIRRPVLDDNHASSAVAVTRTRRRPPLDKFIL